MSFMSSIWGGQNQTLNANIAKTGQIGDWSTSQGEGDVTAGTGFFKDILSGDSGKEAAVLAPEMNAAKTGTYQDVKTTAMFNPRSGGTAASTAATTDKLHGYFANLLGNLKGKAAEELTSAGGGLVGTGLSAYGSQTQMSQQRMRNWSQSILGHAMISGVQTAEEMGELKATGGQSTQASSDYSSGPG
jgi:hypothetical protein